LLQRVCAALRGGEASLHQIRYHKTTLTALRTAKAWGLQKVVRMKQFLDRAGPLLLLGWSTRPLSGIERRRPGKDSVARDSEPHPLRKWSCVNRSGLVPSGAFVGGAPWRLGL